MPKTISPKTLDRQIEKKVQATVKAIVSPGEPKRRRTSSNSQLTTRERMASRRIERLVKGVERKRKPAKRGR